MSTHPEGRKNEKNRPFLKWPGGKFRLIDRIRSLLPQGKTLIEPFMGSGSVFLNTEYDRYLLNDVNHDLITLYKTLQQQGFEFIQFCQSFFTQRFNTEQKYYNFRTKFNRSKDPLERSALFLYLNRHGYNGLCRYNAEKGEFNVPFGRYVKPYFPEKEMQFFYKKSKRATFVCEDFTKTLRRTKKGTVVYCDPPYVPLSATANFTSYQAGGFSLEEQSVLAHLAMQLASKGIPVLVSNHSTELTKTLYQAAHITEFPVQRLISCKATDRRHVIELLALFSTDNSLNQNP